MGEWVGGLSEWVGELSEWVGGWVSGHSHSQSPV